MSPTTTIGSLRPARSEVEAPAAPADAEALAAFLADGDEAAFAILVRRHGVAVLRECRRWLGERPEAEDAFQATFVVLVRNAGTIRDGRALGPWLKGVASRVARKAKTRADRLRVREAKGVDVDSLGTSGDDSGPGPDARRLLRDEVARLPIKYRQPIQLCYWDGLTGEQAAERIGCPTGTIKWRLARGREILRGRLERRGLAGLALILAWLRPKSASAGPNCGLAGHEWDELADLGRVPCAESGRLPESLVRRTVAAATAAREGLGPLASLAASTLRRKGQVRACISPGLTTVGLGIGLIAGVVLAFRIATAGPLSGPTVSHLTGPAEPRIAPAAPGAVSTCVGEAR